MSIPGIESLGPLVDRLRTEGSGAATALMEQMRVVEQSARANQLEDLARMFRCAAASVQDLASAPQCPQHHVEVVLAHLTALVDFACRCASVQAAGGNVAALVPPDLLVLPEVDEQQHFAASVGMFAAQAIGSIAEIEAQVLGSSATEPPAPAIAQVRRAVYALKAGFGVLDLSAAQQLCDQVGATIDAGGRNQQPFPVAAMLQFVDVMKQFLTRLSHDHHAEIGDTTQLSAMLSGLADDAADSSLDQPVVLAVSGEFAGSVMEFVDEAQCQLANAAAASLADQPSNHDRIDRTRRAFHTIRGVGGFLSLTPLVELAQATATRLSGALARGVCTRSEIDLVLAAHDMLQQMLHSLRGHEGPTVRGWQALMAKLSARAVAVGEDDPAPVVGASASFGSAGAAAASPVSVSVPVSGPVSGPAPDLPSAPLPMASRSDWPRIDDRPDPERSSGADLLVDMVEELVHAQSRVLESPAVRQSVGLSALDLDRLGRITRDLQAAAMSLQRPASARTLVDGAIVGVGPHRYVLPTQCIRQGFRPSAADVHQLVGLGECVQVAGAVLPVFRLKKQLGLSEGLDDLAAGILLVCEVDGRRGCLFVDEVVGQQAVVARPLGLPRALAAGFAAAAVVAGQVVLILDIGACLTPGSPSIVYGWGRAGGRGRSDVDRIRFVAGQYLSFELANEHYAIATSSVCEVVDTAAVTPMRRASAGVCGVIHTRGRIVPVIDLRQRFGMTPAASDARSCIVVADLGGDPAVCVGCLVDAVQDVRTIDAEHFLPTASSANAVGDCIFGLARMQDRVLILLDLERALGDLILDPGRGLDMNVDAGAALPEGRSTAAPANADAVDGEATHR